MNPEIGISVVVRTSNSARQFKALLSLLQLGANDEVVVVDSGSTDGTVALAQAAGARIIVHKGGFHYSTTLNEGFAAAKNPWVLALSVHCFPFGCNLLDAYRQSIKLYGARAVMFSGSIVASKRQARRQIGEKPVLLEPDVPNITMVSGNGNRLYSKSAWARHPFDETIPRAEDAEWMIWARRQNCCVVHTPSACVLYRNPGSLKYMFKKGYGDATVCFENGHTPRTIPFRDLLIASLSHTKNCLILEQSPRIWIGQLAQALGAFLGSRKGT